MGGSNFYICTAPRRESLIFKVQSKEIFFLHLQYLKKCIIDEKEEESGASCLTIVNNVKTFTRCTKGPRLLLKNYYEFHIPLPATDSKSYLNRNCQLCWQRKSLLSLNLVSGLYYQRNFFEVVTLRFFNQTMRLSELRS